jgi:hypothetical protein
VGVARASVWGWTRAIVYYELAALGFFFFGGGGGCFEYFAVSLFAPSRTLLAHTCAQRSP